MDEWFLHSLASQPFLIGLTAAFFGGSSIILILATTLGTLNIYPLPFLCGAVLGNWTADSVWFWLGRTHLIEKLVSHRTLAKGYAKVKKLSLRFSRHEPLFFILIKFAYGLRIISVLFYGSIRMAWDRFARLNGVAVLIINLVVIAAGWMVGRGVDTYLDVAQRTSQIVSAIVIAFVLFAIFKLLFNRLLEIRRDYKERRSRLSH